MLFDEKRRTSTDSIDYGESSWDYLDRSGRGEAQRVRDFIEFWFGQFPEQERIDLASRLSSADNHGFRSASFEIILFALLHSIGCSIAVHPDVEGTSKKPDFLVTTPSGENVYVEAVLASDYSAEEIAARRRADVVLKAIQTIDSPNFMLGIHTSGNPKTQPGAKKLCVDLERWLKGLDPDDVYKTVSKSDGRRAPTYAWKDGDWEVLFEAIPRRPERRIPGRRVIGAMSSGVRWANSKEPIREAVRRKGSRYGKLPHPLIVAVNVDSMVSDSEDDLGALIGQEEHVDIRTADGIKSQIRRQPNGAWTGNTGPQYTRVSSAWIFHNFDPWNFLSRKNTLFFNPWASQTLPSAFDIFHHMRIEGGKEKWIEGSSLASILHLPAGWPESS